MSENKKIPPIPEAAKIPAVPVKSDSQYQKPTDQEPGKNYATASLVLGVISLASCFVHISGLVGIGCGICGLVFALKAKKDGCKSSLPTIGLVCSVIGLVISVLAILYSLYLLIKYYSFYSSFYY